MIPPILKYPKEVNIPIIFLKNLQNVVFWNDVEQRHIYHCFTAISTHITLKPAVNQEKMDTQARVAMSHFPTQACVSGHMDLCRRTHRDVCPDT